MKRLLYTSLACNALLIFFFAGKRIYYSHFSQPVANSDFYLKWNAGRDNVYGVLPIDTADIVFAGNSLTEGFPVNEFFPHLAIKNRGIGGNTIATLALRVEHILRYTPRKLFLEIGINDIRQGLPTDKIIQSYDSLLSKIRSGHTKVYIQSIFPVSMEEVKWKDSVMKINSNLLALCSKKGFEYINVFDALQKNNELDSNYTYDGVHLNGTGYKRWAGVVSAHL